MAQRKNTRPTTKARPGKAVIDPTIAALTVADLKHSPTARTYADLVRAYDHFNRRLFDGRLPACLITMQRKAKAYGYFAGGRFGSREAAAPAIAVQVDQDQRVVQGHHRLRVAAALGAEIRTEPAIDEIALNPSHFGERTTEQSLSTLVHEMVHLWQHHFGKPSRNGYHNKQWADQMRAIGLVPSTTGQPGGKETGQKVSHFIEAGGLYQRAFGELAGFDLYVELWDDDAAKKQRKKKAASKTKYTCPTCSVNAWAKPKTMLICGVDEVLMFPEDGDDDDAAGDDA